MHTHATRRAGPGLYAAWCEVSAGTRTLQHFLLLTLLHLLLHTRYTDPPMIIVIAMRSSKNDGERGGQRGRPLVQASPAALHTQIKPKGHAGSLGRRVGGGRGRGRGVMLMATSTSNDRQASTGESQV